ncbi:MAG: hypothetical protein KDB11_13080 [Planctomycetales bacterium]|nr:hypothetical protein [Planctomycetales bacterium]
MRGKLIMQRVLIAICFLATCVSIADAQRPGRRGFRAFVEDRGRWLIDLEEVRKELSVDEQQAELLDALQEDLTNQRRAIQEEEFGPRSADDSVQRLQAEALHNSLAAFDRRSEELIAVVLEPKQASRLTELYLQRDGIRALDRPGIVSKLELSDEQKQRLQSLRESLVEIRPRRSSWDEAQRLIREKEQAGLKELLNEEQQNRWQQLLGKPFEFPASWPRFR